MQMQHTRPGRRCPAASGARRSDAAGGAGVPPDPARHDGSPRRHPSRGVEAGPFSPSLAASSGEVAGASTACCDGLRLFRIRNSVPAQERSIRFSPAMACKSSWHRRCLSRSETRHAGWIELPSGAYFVQMNHHNTIGRVTLAP